MMISIAANSQTNYYLRTDSIKPGTTTTLVKPAVSNLKAWTTDPAGTITASGATVPKNFTADGQIFNIQTNGYTNTKAWVISGVGSKLVIGTKDSIISFTSTNPSQITATVDVLTNATLSLQVANTSTITLGNLAVGSTVRYQGNNTGANQVVLQANYYNLSLVSGGSAYNPLIFPTSPIGVAGIFSTRASSIYGSTINFNGSGGQAIPAGNYYNLTISGTKSVPDTLKGTVNVAAVYSDISTGAKTLSYTVAANGTITAAGLVFNGLIPQAVPGRDYYNLNFTNGQSFNVSNFNNANKTITLYQGNPELAIGQKISNNPTNASVVIDTSSIITAISSDTIITFSNAPTIKAFVNRGSHITGAKPDTVYIASYSLVDSSITLTSGSVNIGDTINSQIVTKTPILTAQVGSVITLPALKLLINLYNLGTITIGSADRKPSDKTLAGDFTIVNAFAPSATGQGTAVLGNINATGVPNFSYVGKKQNIGGLTYNNLTINEDSATTATLTGSAVVKGTFTLQSGKLNTSNTGNRILTLDVNASFPAVTNDTFFVNGPLTKNFASTTPFTYQIGAVVANICHPRKVVITPATTDPKTYTASFAWAKVGNATKIDSSTVFSIDTASNYTIKGSNYNGADSTAKITFQYSYDTAINNSLVLAQYVGGKFKSQGATKLASTASAGTITTDNYIGTFGSFAFGFNPSLLPVTFGTVSASAIGSSVKVSWQSLTEVNVASYVVEGSADGVTFTDKGTVAAKGASEYSFVDVAPSVGVNYYRIKEVDNNGSTTYSAVVAVKESALAASLSIYPNPVSDKQLKFVLNTDAANYTLKVTNVLGQTVLAKTIAHNGGTTSYSVSLPSIKAGTYFVKLSNGANQLTKTVIVE